MNKIMVSIIGLDKRAVLAALYNRAITGGMGFMHYNPTPMTVEQAGEILRSFDRITKKILFWEIEKRPANKYIYFDYLGGRPMKVDLTSDEEFDAWQYDRPDYNGEGAAEDAIRTLRETGDVNPSDTQAVQFVGVLAAAEKVRANLNEESRWEGSSILHLGLADVADKLGPKVDESLKRLRDQ